MVHDFPQSDERKTAIDVLIWLAVAHPQTGPTSPRLGRYLYEYRVLEKIHRTQLDGEAWAEYDAARDQINNQHIEFVVQAIREANNLAREYQARLAARRAAALQSEPDSAPRAPCPRPQRKAAPKAAASSKAASAHHSPSHARPAPKTAIAAA